MKHKIIIASAISSNHYREAQAMLRNFHRVLLPRFSNLTLVVYDIGLSPHEHEELQKHCRCVVKLFPFHRLPDFFSTIKCFAWKVFIIAAHYHQAEVLVWADASVRFTNVTVFLDLVQRTREMGIQQRWLRDMAVIPKHTLPEMFERFGDSPCAYLPFEMVEANFGLYHREPLIERAVIQPWLSCAVRSECICPEKWKSLQICRPVPRKRRVIGVCHRFDQSMLSIIMARLFREKYHHFAVNTQDAQVTLRLDRANYFKSLQEGSPQHYESSAGG